MPPHDPELLAYRQTLRAGCIGFAIGLAAAAGTLGWVSVRYLVPAEGWWALPTLLQFAFYAILGGMALSAAAMSIVSRRHYASGVYRCWQCRRPLRGIGIPCACMTPRTPTLKRVLPPSRWRHYRRAVRPVLLAYAGVLPLGAWVALAMPGGDAYPLAVEIAIAHAGLCVVLAFAIEAASAVLEFAKRWKRLRLRATVFVRVFLPLPAAMFFVALVLGDLARG
jgi:hypothetical protein